MARQKSVFRVIAEPLAIAVALAFLVRSAASLYTIPSTSMVPSLQVGDHILVTPYRGAMPRRGEVIVFHAPDRPSELRVKRVVALPGDLIDSTAGRVRIGGHAIPEPYLLKQAATGEIDPQIIPADSLFVMGDNREDSLDSRRLGPLSRALVVGRVRMVVWSSGSGEGSTAGAATHSTTAASGGRFRLDRIFKCVE